MAEEEELNTPLIADLYKPPALLPIAQLKDPLLYAIETYPVTIIVSCFYLLLLILLLITSIRRSEKQEAERQLRFLNFSTKQAGRPTVLKLPSHR